MTARKSDRPGRAQGPSAGPTAPRTARRQLLFLPHRPLKQTPGNALEFKVKKNDFKKRNPFGITKTPSLAATL